MTAEGNFFIILNNVMQNGKICMQAEFIHATYKSTDDDDRQSKKTK